MQTLIIYKLGINQNYHTFTLISLRKMVQCGKFPSLYHFFVIMIRPCLTSSGLADAAAALPGHAGGGRRRHAPVRPSSF